MLSNVFNVTAFDLNDGFPSTTAATLYVYSLFCSRFLSVYEYTFCTFAFVSVVSFSSTICLIVSPLRYTAPEYPSASVAFTSILPPEITLSSSFTFETREERSAFSAVSQNLSFSGSFVFYVCFEEFPSYGAPTPVMGFFFLCV